MDASWGCPSSAEKRLAISSVEEQRRFLRRMKMNDYPPVLKDTKCTSCGGRIGVLKTTEKGKDFVNCGRCISCLKDVVLPCEDYYIFVNRHCETFKE